MLIGLNGRLKSGKDSTFLIIQELYPGAQRISFAESLKESAAASLGMSRTLIEELKQHENIRIEIGGVGSVLSQLGTDCASEATKWHINMREFLQRYGTEAHRDIFGNNFWVDQVLPLDFDHHNELYVVTDMRFPNEVKRVLELDGHTVKVERVVQTAHSSHASEQDVDYMIEYFLNNTGTLDDLREEVTTMLETFVSKTIKVGNNA